VRFVLATGNRNKVREFRAILTPHPVIAMPAGIVLPPEGITSFHENALQKARALAAALAADPTARTQAVSEVGGSSPASDDLLVCLADDSGLEVEALDWAPGVTSARFAGKGADDGANNAKLLSQLEGYSLPQRRARFVCVVAAVLLPATAGSVAGQEQGEAGDRGSSPASAPVVAASLPGLREYVATGEWWGAITAEPHGDGGFGYDPVFLPEGSDLTVAQLPQEVKDQASHRALAGRTLLELLQREGLCERPHHQQE
jgi:XTP/dITP diphosphohydrolase